jgi:HTH-type transcriptional regulator/antitoxin HigA
MSKYITNDKTPAEAIHVGEVLKDELKARNIKQKDFAGQIAVKPNVLSELLKGKRNMTAELAVKIENALSIEAEFWLKFQAQYEIDLVRIKMKNQIKQANITPAKKQTLIKAVA